MSKYDDLTRCLLERRKQYVAAQKKRNKMLAGAATTLCVVALVGVTVWKMPDKKTKAPIVSPQSTAAQVGTTQSTQATEIPYDIIWADTADDTSNGEVVIDSQYGKTVEWGLQKAFENLPENTKAAVAAYPYLVDLNFVWEGKTLQEYSDAFDEERSLFNKLRSLIKIGDELKYGEALLTGTPDGHKWAKELYEETMAYYGEEILSKYIVDGEFLRDKLEEDIEKISGEGSAYYAYESACAAHCAYALEEAEKQLQAQGIDYDASNSEESGCIILFADAEEFASFTMEHIENWSFCLARKGANNRWMDENEVVGDFDGGNI